MAEQTKKGLAPIIIKKKKGGGHGHHGGAWKIALADMMTAMMAFFLVMWICGMDVKTRLGIANYFGEKAVFGLSKPLSWYIIPSGGNPMQSRGTIDETEDAGGDSNKREVLRITLPPRDNIDADVASRVRAMLNSILKDAAWSDLAESVEVRIDEEGLRVDFMEAELPRFFQTGTATPTLRGRALILRLAESMLGGARRAIFEGHTTPRPALGAFGSTWELGSARALTVRQILVDGTRSSERAMSIASYADTRPRFPDNRNDPRNLRVSVLIPYSTQPLRPPTGE